MKTPAGHESERDQTASVEASDTDIAIDRLLSIVPWARDMRPVGTSELDPQCSRGVTLIIGSHFIII